jgi:hypothetical protein
MKGREKGQGDGILNGSTPISPRRQFKQITDLSRLHRHKMAILSPSLSRMQDSPGDFPSIRDHATVLAFRGNDRS